MLHLTTTPPPSCTATDPARSLSPASVVPQTLGFHPWHHGQEGSSRCQTSAGPTQLSQLSAVSFTSGQTFSRYHTALRSMQGWGSTFPSPTHTCTNINSLSLSLSQHCLTFYSSPSFLYLELPSKVKPTTPSGLLTKVVCTPLCSLPLSLTHL